LGETQTGRRKRIGGVLVKHVGGGSTRRRKGHGGVKGQRQTMLGEEKKSDQAIESRAS